MTTRKAILPLIAALSATGLSGQEPWRQVLSADPVQANGFFIINTEKATSLGLASLQVDIIEDLEVPGASLQQELVQSFTITDKHFGRMDLGLLQGLQTGASWHYELHGFSELGIPLVDVSSLGDGEAAWPEACRETCVSNQYAWALVGYSDGAQTFIEMQNAVDATGWYFYFFVPAAEWATFKVQHATSDFGLSWATWSQYELSTAPAPFNNGVPPQYDVIHINSLPDGAPGVNGGPLGANYAGQSGWAIRKDRGPWRDLFAYTENYSQPSELCLDLRERYNLDPMVTAARNANIPAIPQVTCMSQSIFGGGTSWGDTGPSENDDCWNQALIYSTNPLGDVDAAGWVNTAIDCIRENQEFEQEEMPHSITVYRREAESFSVPFEVVLPSVDDPKLVPMPRTALAPGLYEFVVLMNNGTLFRRFEEFTEEVKLEASFAAFADISIYPVPVRGPDFAIDFDIDYPMNVSVTVMDNAGAPVHQAQLAFALAGKNKHVVHMPEPWPAGLYHAVFLYDDGSTDSRSFTVEE